MPTPLEKMNEAAARFIAGLMPRERATVVTLSGELGAGKTTFSQAIARCLGIEERVTSPTFVIENIYPLRDQKWRRFIHIDAYRLEDPKELIALEFNDIISDPGNLVVLEWPERVQQVVPRDAISIRFDIRDDMRIININGQPFD